MSGHVGERARVQQEPSTRPDDLCDISEACGVAHCVRVIQRPTINDMPILGGWASPTGNDVLAKELGQNP
jgi:hypothetical protein